MESRLYAVAFIILAVAGLGNCRAVDRELRKINFRINNMQQNMQQKIADLEFENRELRQEFEWLKLNSALSSSSSEITDNGTKDNDHELIQSDSTSCSQNQDGKSTIREELQKIEGVVNLLAEDVEHLKNKSFECTNQLEVSVRKAFGKEKVLIRKLNETLQSKQKGAMKEIRDFIAKSNASLERHKEDTTSKYEETKLEMTTQLGNIITAMTNTDIRISQNEKLLKTLSDCGSHMDVPHGNVSGDTSVGGTPVISCNSGYSQTGSAQCKVPAAWETDVKCQKDCAILHVANGMVSPATIVPHGTTVTVTCDSGYVVVGNNTTVCNNGGFTSAPSCRRGFYFTDMVIGSSSSFNIKLDDDNDTPFLSGAEFLLDGRLILCDLSNYRIKLLSTDFTVIDNLKLQSWPWDVSAVNSTDVIITLPNIKLLQYVNVLPHFSQSRTIQLDKPCYGVDVAGDEIFTSCFNILGAPDGEVMVFDLGGRLKTKLMVQKDNSYIFVRPFYLTVKSKTSYIHVTDAENNKVTCLSSSGDVKYQYDDLLLDGPLGGVYVDDADDIIVCGTDSNNVYVITASGKKHRILLSSADGLQEPYSVAYRQSDATLVIGSRYNNNLLVFKAKY